MDEITLLAKEQNLDDMLAFIHSHLTKINCPMKIQMQIDIAAEEIFVNIARYAYHRKEGSTTVRCSVGGNPMQIIIQFLDNGIPFNPLKNKEPDITLNAEARQPGGLGILIAKKSMDDIRYEYKNGKNILTIKKNILG